MTPDIESSQNQVTYRRSELYEQVWKEPVRTVAKRYGVSDVALGKICRKLSVPLPGLGYWTRIRLGQTVPRPPLPQMDQHHAERRVGIGDLLAPRFRARREVDCRTEEGSYYQMIIVISPERRNPRSRMAMSWIYRMQLVIVAGVLCGSTPSHAAEIGFDAGVAAHLDREHDITISAPIVRSSQVVRVGLALSDHDELEVAPRFFYSSSAEPRSTISLGLSYLRGRVDGGHPSPYARVGWRWRMDSFSEPSHFTASQFSLSTGAGLRWRVGKVLGLRTEASVERMFQGSGFREGWDLFVLGGVSAFTN
jgi:hypothetical protein